MGLVPHSSEDRFQEAAEFIQGHFIIRGNGGLYCPHGFGCHDFKSANKNAHNFCGCGTNGEWQNVVDEAARHDVDEAATLFEPGVPPGLYHGMCFVWVETLSDENPFQIAAERIYAAGQHRRVENRYIR